ncbi:MAG: DUF4230 domain-containing protein [Bacteroidota bacterium]
MFSSRKVILLTVLLVTVGITAYVLLVTIPTRIAQRGYEGAKTIGKDLRELFQFTPEITVNNTVIVQQQTPVLELATLSQRFQHHYQWTNTWMRSTKEITITGSFEAKAGFDLKEKFAITIYDDHAVITLPEPKLLSLEPAGDISFKDENGIWNWVNQDDRTQAVNAFQKDARRYASQAQFIQDAKTKMEEQLLTIVKPHVKTAEVRFTTTINRQQ